MCRTRDDQDHLSFFSQCFMLSQPPLLPHKTHRYQQSPLSLWCRWLQAPPHPLTLFLAPAQREDREREKEKKRKKENKTIWRQGWNGISELSGWNRWRSQSLLEASGNMAAWPTDDLHDSWHEKNKHLWVPTGYPHEYTPSKRCHFEVWCPVEEDFFVEIMLWSGLKGLV